jgi:hypothetical protein
MRALRLTTIAGLSALALALAPAPAPAQTQCLEGKTVSGTCLDASLGSMMREGVRVFTQPRLSYSGPAVAPSSDRKYDVLRDLRQQLHREIYGPCVDPRCP